MGEDKQQGSTQQKEPNTLSAERQRFLSDKNAWLDVKDKAERLVIADEIKSMPVIAKTVQLLDILLEIGLQSLDQT